MTTGLINNSIPPYITDTKEWSGSDGKLTPGGDPQWNAYWMRKQLKVLTPTTGINAPYGYTCDCGANLPTPDTNLEIKALNKVVDKAKGHSFNLAVATAESRQTYRLIKDNFLTVARCAIDVKHGRIKSAVQRFISPDAVRSSLSRDSRNRLSRVAQTTARKTETSDLMSRWLELQYGWRPLLSDIEQSINALHAKRMRKTYIEIKKSAGRKSGFNEVSSSPSNYSILMKYEEYCTIHYRWIMDLDPVSPASLGLMDPLTVAWELMPFSFVADWFIPVGAYLTAANQVPLLGNGEIMISKFIKGSTQPIQFRSGDAAVAWEGCSSKIDYVRLDRTVIADAHNYHVPPPSFKSLEDAMSPLHLANAAALLQTALSSGNNANRFRPTGF